MYCAVYSALKVFYLFGDIQPKIVRLNLGLIVDYEELLKELKLETTFAVFMFSH